jgi:pyrroloquinoline quinone (PQQ) biosynthesis protein C
MDIEEFLDALTGEVMARHAYLHHPFFQLMYDGKLTRQQVQGWAKQFFVIPKTHLINNAGKLAHAQLIAGGPFEQLLESPYDREITRELGGAVMDELGHTEISPEDHWEPFLRLTDELDIPRDRVGHPDELLPTSLIVMYSWTESAKNFPLLDLIGSHNFVNDPANVAGCPRICEALTKHYGLSQKAVSWFDLHGEVDVEHGAMARKILAKYVRTDDQRRQLRYAVNFGLGIFWTLHCGVLDAYVNQTYPLVNGVEGVTISA